MDDYLEVRTECTDTGISIKVDGKNYAISFPRPIWSRVEEQAKTLIADHVAFLSTNYLPMLSGAKGIRYDSNVPMFKAISFESMMYDLPSSAFLDGMKTVDYLREYFNLDFVFDSVDPMVWSRHFKHTNTAIISFTSGKDSLLTAAVCRELGIEPILLCIEEPCNTYEWGHRQEILKRLNQEFGLTYYSIRNELGILHNRPRANGSETSLGWGNQLMYYLFLFLPFVLYHRARYLFYGNELSCDKEIVDNEGFRANFCYDQSTGSTSQLDVILQTLTQGSARVGSLVGPLNEIAIMRCLHQGYPQFAKYQMSCFCDDPVTENYRWCCNCSKCARNYAFLRALGREPKELGFWRDMFTDECLQLFSAANGQETYGFDRSGLGKDEQDLALFLASINHPENQFLQSTAKSSKYMMSTELDSTAVFKEDFSYFFSVHESRAVPRELRDRVYELYDRLLQGDVFEASKHSS